ncbi:MAG TPA: hypothetical protein VFL14_01205, partial [Xanthomonadales bacterium]|nr:hypothetical protein [Xanthomonadales bacterium]
MRARAHVILLIGFVASLAFNLVLNGGLAKLPEGKVFVDSARRESPVMLAYMTLGRWAVAIPGVDGVGESLARAAYGPAFAAAQESPTAASDLIE